MKKKFLFILAALFVVLNSCSSSNPKNGDITKANTSIFTSYEKIPSLNSSPSPTSTPSQTLIKPPESVTQDEKPEMHINLQDYDANTDKKYLHYETDITPIATKEDIEKLIREYLCGEWIDINKGKHVITEKSFDDRDIYIYYGRIYNNNCFGFQFNFIENPLDYPLFLTRILDNNYILIETYAGGEWETNELWDTEYFVRMQWMKENAEKVKTEHIYENQKFDAYYKVFQ